LNNDGRLTFEEIRSGIDTLSRASPRFSKAEYLKIMEAIDKDHNKYIDYQEFIAAATDKTKLVNRETLQAAFRTFDRDSSGRITREELRMVFDTMGTRKDQTLWLEIMSEVDKDGDGQIDFEEFAGVMEEQVKRKRSLRGGMQHALKV